jgi:hypothetical protein
VAAGLGQRITPALIAAAQRDLRSLHVGWVLVWLPRWTGKGVTRIGHPRHPLDYPTVYRYLAGTGFRLGYQAEGVAVYRPGG